VSGFSPDHPSAEVRISPNFGPRAGDAPIDMILLHYTGMVSGEAAEHRLCDAASEVSSHYLVHEDGRIVQMVREADRAWHAGKSSWRGATDINSCSIGLEIVNPGHQFGYTDFDDRQIESVTKLCADIVARHAVPSERVLGHSDVAPGRKIDPGEKFPWGRLAMIGIGHFVVPDRRVGEPALSPGDRGPPVEMLQSMLSVYGYGIDITGEYGSQTQVVVAAFQRHFRPQLVDGIAERSTVETLRALLESLPSPP
jgi:N-acetylmuramoyl-L-alanine amidase